MRRTAGLLALVVLIAAGGCSRFRRLKGGGGRATDGGEPTCGTRDDPNTGERCNKVMATGPCVTPTLANGSPPAATGGPLEAGTYDQVSTTIYGRDEGSNDEPGRQTMIITGSGTSFTMEMAQLSGTMLRRQNGTITLSGTDLTFKATCPPPGVVGDNSGTQPYSASGSSVTVYDVGRKKVIRLQVFKKR